jgi:hypothetical protein
MSTDANLPGHVTYRVINFIRQFAHRHWGILSSPALEAWEQEIHYLEQNLADEATRPNRINRRARIHEPLTEQQRIIDLAG